MATRWLYPVTSLRCLCSPSLQHARGYAKKGIHPRVYDTEVVMTDGSTFTTKSTIPGSMKLTEDCFNTFPWVPLKRILDTSGQLSKYSKRFEQDDDDDFQVPGQ